VIDASLLIDVAGWSGAGVVTVAYGFVSYGWVDGRSGLYQTLNAVAGLLLAVNTAWHHAWPSAIVNVIWTGIAIGTLAVSAKHCAERLRASGVRAAERSPRG